MKVLKPPFTAFILLLCCLFTDCEAPENEFEGTIPLEIKEVTIPETGQVNSDIQILAYTEASNGCFKDLKITLRQISSQFFLLRGTSFFESANTCPAGMVSLDTTIVFKTASAGTYYFQTNEDPFTVKLDTLVVN